jgi:hypothetical protein
VGFAEFIDHWWNLPFLVMLGLVVVFFGMQAVGIASHGGDADVDHDVDADVDHDVPADADAQGDAPDGDADHDSDSIGLHEVLAFFGVGRVPFMVVWVVLFIFVGAFGLFWNSFFFTHAGGAMPPWGFPASLGLSLAIGLVAVRLFSRVAARFVDVGGKGSSTKHELAGSIGVVASAKIDGRFGEVRVRDAMGNEILVHAKMTPGERDLARGDEVILVEYDGGSELFTATTGGKRVMTGAADAGSEATGADEAAKPREKKGRST